MTGADFADTFSSACRDGAIDVARAMHATGNVTPAQVDEVFRNRKIFGDIVMLEWLLSLNPAPGAVEQLMYRVVTGPDSYEDDATFDAWLATHRRLIEWGATPGNVTAGTLIAVALDLGRDEFAEWLMAQRVPLAHARALTGQLPMHRAREALDRIPMREPVEKQAMLAGALQSADVVRAARALEAGANPDLAYPEVDWRNDFLPLALAARAESTECVELLLRAGANVNGGNGVALTIAAEFGVHEIVRALLAAGADPDADNGAALFAAAGQGEIACMELLVEAGANVNAADLRALREAEDAKQTEAAAWLRARGAGVQGPAP